MMGEEQFIRDLVASWHHSISCGAIEEILRLMSDDVLFMVTGHPPMRGRDAFENAFHAVKQKYRLESHCDIQEIEISGDLAHCWSRLEVTVTPLAGGTAKHRTGNTLTILRKGPEGKWLVIRDANMLEVEP